MVKSGNLIAVVLGGLAFLPLAACERAQEATETAADAAREAAGDTAAANEATAAATAWAAQHGLTLEPEAASPGDE